MAVDAAAPSGPPFEPATIRRYQQTATIAGAVGLALCALGWFLTPDHFFRSYLWAYCFFLGIALGALVLDMLQFLTGGVWGLVLGRILEATSRTLPILLLLFIPIAAGFIIPARTSEPTGRSPSSRPLTLNLDTRCSTATISARARTRRPRRSTGISRRFRAGASGHPAAAGW